MNVEDRRKDGIAKKIADSELVKKLKSIKNVRIIALVFIIALGLIIYSTVSATKEEDVKSTVQTQNEDEARLSSILSNINGAGEVESLITESDGKIVGVLVIAQGADNPLVRLRLVQAVSSALGVDEDIVCVLAKNK